MDEARRFLRYVIPGSLFAVQTVLFLLIVRPRWTVHELKALPQGNDGLVLAIGALLGSGALGFLFSTIHHWLHWRNWPCHPGVDYRPITQRLRSEGLTTVPEQQTAREAWSIVTALWHERVGNGSNIQAANPRADTLANLVHSVGAATVATVMAFPAASFVLWHVRVYVSDFSWLGFRLTFVLWVVLILLHELSYQNVLEISRSFVEQVLTDALRDEEEEEEQEEHEHPPPE